jgi:hypothetical protein
MKVFSRKTAAAFFFVFTVSVLDAVEYTEGRVKLALNGDTGRFSLYYMTDMAQEEYQPFFFDKDPRTSFLAISVNDRNYRMGETAAFRVSIGGTASDPALIFDSHTLTVTEQFSFIRTGGAILANGIKITVIITNKSEKNILAGARLLFDTSLGEESANHFSTGERQIISETALTAGSKERYWVSGNGRFGLMGSVAAADLTEPDLLHFANWKRLNDVSWKTPFSEGRNFNLLPYSIGDSAVCYYFEPAALEPGVSRVVSLALAAQDPAGFAGYAGSLSNELSRILRESAESLNDLSREAMRSDLILLRDLGALIDSRAASGAAVPGEEMDAIRTVISRLKTKYGVP